MDQVDWTGRGHIIASEKDLYFVSCLKNGQELCLPCKGKGVFRARAQRPVVGDFVDVSLRADSSVGTILCLHERKNLLNRPPVANVDQVLLVQTLVEPALSALALDKMLASIEQKHLPLILCFNKLDRSPEGALTEWMALYRRIGYPCFQTDALQGTGVEELCHRLTGKITAVAGPSGAGKSSLIRKMTGAAIEVGRLASKTGRGRQTTRQIRLYDLGQASYIFDTPGFSSLELESEESLQMVGAWFPEIRTRADQCRFRNCLHRNEPACRIKEALAAGEIAPTRYASYLRLLEEMEQRRSY